MRITVCLKATSSTKVNQPSTCFSVLKVENFRRSGVFQCQPKIQKLWGFFGPGLEIGSWIFWGAMDTSSIGVLQNDEQASWMRFSGDQREDE